MYAGRIVESGTREQVLFDPLHPYTKGLIQCLPKLNASSRRLVQIKGIMPGLLNLPEGCYFRDRCPEADSKCLVYPEQRNVKEKDRVMPSDSIALLEVKRVVKRFEIKLSPFKKGLCSCVEQGRSGIV